MTKDFATTFRGKKIFLTGHTGFKGAWLSLWLSKLGADVAGYSLDPDENQESLFLTVSDSDVFTDGVDIRGNILDLENLSRSVAEHRPEFVFHLAAQSLVRRSYEQPVETVAANVLGTANLLEAVRRGAPDAVVVVVTTDKCYENQEWAYSYRENEPLGGKDVYSASKAASELVVASWRHSFFRSGDSLGAVATARGGNVVGGGDFASDRIVPDLVRALSKQETLSVRSPESTRPWQHVLDCLSGYLRLAEWLSEDISGESSSRSFNFGPAQESERTVRSLVEECLTHWPGSWEDTSGSDVPYESSRLAVSIELAKSALDWHPTWNFAATVKNTMAWYAAWDRDPSPSSLLRVMEEQIEEFSGTPS